LEYSLKYVASPMLSITMNLKHQNQDRILGRRPVTHSETRDTLLAKEEYHEQKSIYTASKVIKMCIITAQSTL